MNQGMSDIIYLKNIILNKKLYEIGLKNIEDLEKTA